MIKKIILLSLVATVLTFFSPKAILKDIHAPLEKERLENKEKLIIDYYPFELGKKVVRGKEEAKHVIVYYGDYQCAACVTFYEETLGQLAEKFIDTGKAKFYHFDVATVNDVSYAKSMLGTYIESKYPEIYHTYVEKMHFLTDRDNQKLTNKVFMVEKMSELFPGYDFNEAAEIVFLNDMELKKEIEANKNYLLNRDIEELPSLFIDGRKVNNIHSIQEATLRMLDKSN